MSVILILITFDTIVVLCPMDGPKVAGKKVAIGKNNLTPQYSTPTMHAEMDAYLKLQNYYKSFDLDMVVVRFTKEGKLCQSRPCYHCIKTLLESGLSIKNVYYSRDDEMHKEKFCDMLNSQLTKISSGMRQKTRNKSRKNI